MDLLFARAFFVAFMAAILAFKVWVLIAGARRKRGDAELAPRRPDYRKIARLEWELGITADRANEK